jgi:hypothetical protein
MKQKRLAWANKYRSCTTDDLKKVAFSGESHYFVQGDGTSVVRRSGDEPVRVEHLQQTVKYLPKMFWDFFIASGPGSVVPVDGMLISSKYIKILKSIVLLLLQTFADGKGTFEHDLAPCHNKKAVKNFVQENKISMLNYMAILQT